VTKDNMNSILC